MEQLNFNTDIFIGNDALVCLEEYSNERICIVTDKFMVDSHLIDFVTTHINESNTYDVFTDIVPDPTIDNVVSGVATLASFKPTLMIAFGGGSAIDAAKAIKFFGIKLEIISELTMIVIPTTSGTGSEVTNFAVITNPNVGLKYPLVDGLLQPDKAILDARLVKTVPPKITADTGMDVLTHALEAYVSTGANDFSDALAEKATDLIFKYLERAFRNGEDMEAREKVHYASCIAGMAFNQASLGLCHGIAHTLGGKLHMPHGRINGVLLPSIIQFNANESQRALDKYAQLARKQGLANSHGKVGVRHLVNEVIDLRQKLEMPSSFLEAGFIRETYQSELNQVGREALLDPTTRTNPVQPTKEQVKQIIWNLF